MPQCQDADISTDQAQWPYHVSEDISVHSDIGLHQFLISYFRGTTFHTWLCRANSFSRFSTKIIIWLNRTFFATLPPVVYPPLGMESKRP